MNTMICRGMKFFLVLAVGLPLAAQEPAPTSTTTEPDKPSTEVIADGLKAIILSAAKQPEPAFLYTANAQTQVNVGDEQIDQSLSLKIKVVQGKAKTVTFGLAGQGEVLEVKGDNVESWALRNKGADRYIDIQLVGELTEYEISLTCRTKYTNLPVELDLLHIKPDVSLGFDSRIDITYQSSISGKVIVAEGFAPLVSDDKRVRFQSSTGGRLQLRLDRQSALPQPIELQETKLLGTLEPNGKSALFQLEAVAEVTKANSRLPLLYGSVAISRLPEGSDYRLELIERNGRSEYEVVFPKEGKYRLDIQFVAAVASLDTNWQKVDFTIAASAVVPITLKGFATDLEFAREPPGIVPILKGSDWLAFLPASGHVHLRWKGARNTGEGKLFFSTNAKIEADVGPGLLRQSHLITYQILQGQLKSLTLQLIGPGEILDVQGANIVGWKVVTEDEKRTLDITLSQAYTGENQLTIRSQTTLGAFPVQVESLRLLPLGAIRHSGYIRISNSGSVRVEPIGVSGLTQLAPEQYPGEAIQTKQLYVYRFPSADYSFSLTADRIQPEVNVSQLVLYQLTEANRVITADIELDIREATIREWDILVPESYSIVSVTGAALADYVVASEVTSGKRNLKIIFGQDIQGRQLVNLRMERNESAVAGDWMLPRIEFPTAKTIRGDIGIVGAPGYRIAVGQTDLLVEKPLSSFPTAVANLQQAFRIRESNWSATMKIEMLDRSIQADVFHLYSLSQGTIYGSALINYFITGAPIAELQISVPQILGNVTVDGQDIRTWRREGDIVTVTLQQPKMGAYTCLVTFEEKPGDADSEFQAGVIAPLNVQGDRGYIEIVSPMQVEIEPLLVSKQLLVLDALELPAEFRLLSTAPALGTWQYTERPFDLKVKVKWYEPGTTAAQVVEYSEANSHVSPDGELVTDVVYYVKSRGQRALKVTLPAEPVRLWAVTVNGQPVTARKAENDTLIPLPGNADPNAPVEVSLRLGKPSVDKNFAELSLPIIYAPVLKTQWNFQGDENYALVPDRGTVQPVTPLLWPTGFDWIMQGGLVSMIFMTSLAGMALLLGSALSRVGLLAVFCYVSAIAVAIQAGWAAFNNMVPMAALQISIPVLAAGEVVELGVQTVPSWRVQISWPGVVAAVLGTLLFVSFLAIRSSRAAKVSVVIAMGLLTIGTLIQPNGAPWFFAVCAVVLSACLLKSAIDYWKKTFSGWRRSKSREDERASLDTGEPNLKATVTTLLICSALWIGDGYGFGNYLIAQDAQSQMPQAPMNQPPGASEAEMFRTLDSLTQQWDMSAKDARLISKGTLSLNGIPGDRFLILRAPAVLTEFQSDELRLTKIALPNGGLGYVVTIPMALTSDDSGTPEDRSPRKYTAVFEYQLEAIKPEEGIPILHGKAALQEIELKYSEPGLEVICDGAARIEAVEQSKDITHVKLLLGTDPSTVFLKRKARNLSTEMTKFFVEGAQLYIPGPGVVNGLHRLDVRASQGQVRDLNIAVPEGLTVSAVTGPVSSWQFDADTRSLRMQLNSDTAANFTVSIETQRGLESLPTDVKLSPLRVSGSDGEVGLIAVAFGSDAQPEKAESSQFSLVNLGDFDPKLLEGKQAALHRVYRYGAEESTIDLRVAAVASEVRVTSRQVLSLGEERLVLAINFGAEITRTGLFQLSFPLPTGLEVESLSGESLHHWSEISEDGKRQVVLHLNSKTIGNQSFSLTLAGATPADINQLDLPRFEINESSRQSGEMVIQPSTGLRLRPVNRQNVSEADPRTLGGQGEGALAFRLLQQDWNLVLGIEKLDPWVTGQVLHDVMLREGQTRSTIVADFNIQNSSIRTLPVVLPITNADELKTVRVSGKSVSDFVRRAADSNVWEIQFKRRIIGKVQFQIEFERRGERSEESENLTPLSFPEAKQLSYFYAVRTGGRLEIEANNFTQGWQKGDWSMVPTVLREAGNRNAPALAIRAVAPSTPLPIRVVRHSLAEALKLRVASGTLNSVLSPTGDQLTAVDITVEVVQRSNLSVQLPEGGELFSIFVNGESVHSIRQTNEANTWQFYILPGIDDRTAQVRFVYLLKGDGLNDLRLTSPQLNVPLENVRWNVIVPQGYKLLDNDGDLELVNEDRRAVYDRQSYLSKVNSGRNAQAQQAVELLEKASQYLQAGEQGKAQWALSNVANQNALDAASNEDARVQLENLQTQQAIVGLNTRRQRLFLDNDLSDAAVGENEQMRQAAADNPILQQDKMNFRPQELSQLLAGNSSEDNAVLQQIAGRLVQHQRTTDPAPQAIVISVPEEGTIYSFSRGVQVTENAPLKLDLKFRSEYRLREWQWGVIAIMLLIVISSVGVLVGRTRVAA